MNRNITFKRISSNGEVTTSFNLKKNDVNSDRLAMLFKLNSPELMKVILIKLKHAILNLLLIKHILSNAAK